MMLTLRGRNEREGKDGEQHLCGSHGEVGVMRTETKDVDTKLLWPRGHSQSIRVDDAVKYFEDWSPYQGVILQV